MSDKQMEMMELLLLGYLSKCAPEEQELIKSCAGLLDGLFEEMESQHGKEVAAFAAIMFSMKMFKTLEE